jgi:hypothetical protein
MRDVGAATVRAVWTDFAGVLTPPLEYTMAVFSSRIGGISTS